jgi:anti-sigma factor RsiW
MADLSALADGTLPADRRAEVEARIAASAELQELLERQRKAVLAAQSVAAEDVPQSLQVAVENLRPRRRRREWARPVPRLAIAGAAVAAAVAAAIVLSGGPGAPTVADAAALAAKAPTAPAPPSRSATKLAIGVEGVTFPDYARAYGWRPLGVRRGQLDGRDATVVFYGKDGRRLAYVIVAGSALTRPSGAQSTVVDGVDYRVLRLGGRPAVTWRRGGHTCVLIGGATRSELLQLASWP